LLSVDAVVVVVWSVLWDDYSVFGKGWVGGIRELAESESCRHTKASAASNSSDQQLKKNLIVSLNDILNTD